MCRTRNLCARLFLCLLFSFSFPLLFFLSFFVHFCCLFISYVSLSLSFHFLFFLSLFFLLSSFTFFFSCFLRSLKSSHLFLSFVFIQDLEEIEAKRRRAIEELRGRLIVLWDQLEVADDIKRDFLEENQGCRQQVNDGNLTLLLSTTVVEFGFIVALL